MITVLTGANSFEWQAVLRQRVATFVAEEGDFSLERLDGEETPFERLQEAVTSLPFLSNKKLIVLRSPSANKQFVEKLESLLPAIPETSDVIILEPKVDKRSAYYKLLKKQPDFMEFTDKDTDGLARWLEAEAKQRGGTLSLGDARYLVERVGGNQQSLTSELDKLLLHHEHITKSAIDVLTEASPQSTIFQLLEAAFAGNSRRALELYGEQRSLKVEPQQILAMLGWQLHVLAIVKAAGDRSPEIIASDAKLNPFVVRKSQATTRRLSPSQLKRLVADLATIDARSKRTALDLDEALQHYLLKLAV